MNVTIFRNQFSDGPEGRVFRRVTRKDSALRAVAKPVLNQGAFFPKLIGATAAQIDRYDAAQIALNGISRNANFFRNGGL